MALKGVNYLDVRDKMQPGDIIAFSGKGFVYDIVKWATRSNITHVAIVLQSKLLINDEPQVGYFNQIIESRSEGILISRLSERIKSYDGEIWWLPLKESIRKKMNLKKYFDFLFHQRHKPYDLPEALKSGIDLFDNTPLLEKFTYNVEDFSKFFCSELAAAALEASEAIPNLNASEVTPSDMCMFNIYSEDYYQLKKENQRIKGYNTISPEGWGE